MEYSAYTNFIMVDIISQLSNKAWYLLATSRSLAVGERVSHLFADPALWVHLMADLHVVGVMHDVLDHVLEHCVPREHRVHLRAAVFRLQLNNTMHHIFLMEWFLYHI